MITVQMEQLTSEEDAYRAALASILELELDDVPRFTGMASEMQLEAWLGAELNLCRFGVGDMQPAVPGYWLARVHSPYPSYTVHTVVMQHLRIVHDPHPEPQPIDITMGVVRCDLLVPLDPALPSGRHAM